MKRRTAVAGSFYPGKEGALRSAIKEFIFDAKKESAKAVLSPHAGYMYSGMVAGAVYSRVRITDTAVLLGPMHRYSGGEFALFSEGSWETPLGEVKIDETLAESLAENCSCIEKNIVAHNMEHSLEVQVPFLQYFVPYVKIVPVLIGTWKYDALKAVGEALAKTIKISGKEVLIVASSDMSHTDSSNRAIQKTKSNLDMQALEKLATLDDKGFYDFIHRNSVTMCGFAPATSAVAAAKALGAKSGEIVDYRTSYDVTGDYSYVVGYGGVIIK